MTLIGMPASWHAAISSPGPAEDQRIAGFETHDAETLPRQRNHLRVDIGLLARLPIAALADIDQSRTQPYAIEDRFCDEIVEEHRVCRLQRSQRLDRQQVRIARPRADERDGA